MNSEINFIAFENAVSLYPICIQFKLLIQHAQTQAKIFRNYMRVVYSSEGKITILGFKLFHPLLILTFLSGHL